MLDREILRHCYRLFLDNNMSIWIDENGKIMIQYFDGIVKKCHQSNSSIWSDAMMNYIMDKR